MTAQPPVPAEPEHAPADPAAAGVADSMTEADADLRSFGYRPELRRSVPTVDLIIYGLIFMVPIAPWAIFGTVYNASEGMVPLVYLVGGLGQGVPRGQRARGRHRQRDRRAGRDLPAAVQHVPGPAAAELPGVNRRQIPQNALLLVSGLTLVLVLFFVGRLGLISSLVNFGALFGFCLLHVSVVNHYVIRKRSRNYLLHLVLPLIGFGIIGYVLTQADTNAKVGGVIWLAVGALVFLYFLLTGRSRELTIGEGA